MELLRSLPLRVVSGVEYKACTAAFTHGGSSRSTPPGLPDAEVPEGPNAVAIQVARCLPYATAAELFI